MLHLTFKFLKTENRFISFGLPLSTHKPACPVGRAQFSPSAAFRVFKVLQQQHFSSLYTLESEQEETIYRTEMNGLGKNILTEQSGDPANACT